jgi:hypothetical protein
MDGQRARQRQVFQRSCRAEDGLRELAVAGVAVDLNLSVKAAVTRLRMGQS